MNNQINQVISVIVVQAQQTYSL